MMPQDKKLLSCVLGGAVVLLGVAAAVFLWVIPGRQPSRGRPGRAETSPRESPARPAQEPEFSRDERKSLLDLARRTIKEVVTNQRLPETDPSGLSSRLTDKRACFVTLKENGELRGCIGHIYPVEPLYQSVIHNARAAAVEDTRFSPVRRNELDNIEIEISVLTVPQPLDFDSPEDLLRKLRPHVDGVVLLLGRRRPTYLPQVWEQIPDKEAFLNNLSQKGGMPAKAWRSPGTGVLTYQVEAFKESEM